MTPELKRNLGGRPWKPKGTARSLVLSVRLSAKERIRLERQAKAQDISLAEALLRPWRACK